MRKTLLKWFLLICLFAYMTAICVWAHGEAARNSCRGVEITILGDSHAGAVTEAGVKEELKPFREKIRGVPLERVNTREIERYLGGFSNFESVECSLTTDGILQVGIVPMVPEIRVFTKDGSYYINKDGKQIESKPNFFVDVPVVSGDFSDSFPARDILPVTRFIGSDPVLSQLVSMVRVNDRDNIILIPRIKGHVVNLGDTTRLAEKRKALLTFYRKVMPYKGWETYDTVSVRFRGQVVASRRDKTRAVHGTDWEDDIDPEEATLPTEPETR